MQTKEVRNERVTACITSKNKKRLVDLKKQENLTPGDIIEIYLDTRMDNYSQQLIKDMKHLDEKIHDLCKIISQQEKILEQYQEKLTEALDEKQQLKDEMKQTVKQDNTENKLKKTVKSFYENLTQHTDTSGNLNPRFSKELVGKNLCVANNVEYSIFLKACEKIHNDDDLKNFLSSNVEDWI